MKWLNYPATIYTLFSSPHFQSQPKPNIHPFTDLLHSKSKYLKITHITTNRTCMQILRWAFVRWNTVLQVNAPQAIIIRQVTLKTYRKSYKIWQNFSWLVLRSNQDRLQGRWFPETGGSRSGFPEPTSSFSPRQSVRLMREQVPFCTDDFSFSSQIS